MKIRIFFTMYCIFIGFADASDIGYKLDVYGTNSLNAQNIINQFGDTVENLAFQIEKGIKLNDEKLLWSAQEKNAQIREEIKKYGDFSFVNISIIFYSDNNHYSTIDIVEKNESSRLDYFYQEPQNDINDVNSLILQWEEYESEGFNRIFQEGFPTEKINCLSWQCLIPNDAPELKAIDQYFYDEVDKKKNALVEVLRNDRNSSKRSSAVHLLAYSKDPKELINILFPSFRDPDSCVRNNAMRLVSSILETETIKEIDLNEVAIALNFPLTTDRNKALCILFMLSEQEELSTSIIKFTGNYLLKNLKMTQPNLHDNAYAILKNISGLSYDDKDYVQWDAWLKSKN